MKRIRLLVVPPTEELFTEAVAQLSKEDLARNGDQIRKQMTIYYKQTIQTALRTPLNAQSGVAIDEMEKSLNVLKVVDVVSDGEVLELEDADHEYLLQKLANVRWQGFDPRVVTLVHTIKNATKDLLEPESNGHSNDTVPAAVEVATAN